MHEEKARLEREGKIRRGLTHILEDVQRRLLHPSILNRNRCLDILLDRYLDDESILYIRGKKTVYKPRKSEPTTLFVTLCVHRERIGIEEEEVELELLSEVLVNKWFDPVGTAVRRFVRKMPQLLVLADLDVVTEYIIFWAIDELGKVIEGDHAVTLLSVESPVWGDLRESVLMKVLVGLEEMDIRVPFSKVHGPDKVVKR